MKYFVTIITCLCFLQFAGKAQINLVLNPSFERYSNCPDNDDEAKYCLHWMSLDSNWSPPDWAHNLEGVPDYCNICSSSLEVSVPHSSRYYHYPHSGGGMMQLYMFYDQSDTGGYVRDYLQGHLSQTLTHGRKYLVTFYTTLEQSGAYAVNNIGAYLDNGSIDTTSHPAWTQTQYTPQIFDTGVINDTLNWVKIQDTFVANGTEKLITIGNFTDLAHIHAIPIHDTTGISSFVGGLRTLYLIDDVSVIDCESQPKINRDTLIYSGDTILLGTNETPLPYKWYISGSTTMIDSNVGGIRVHPTTTTIYAVDQNLCYGKQTFYSRVRVWPDTEMAVTKLSEAQIKFYPNPTAGSVTIEGAKGNQINVYDVVGREVLAGLIAGDKEIIHLEQIVRGVYVVQIVDPVTGLRLVRQVVRE